MPLQVDDLISLYRENKTRKLKHAFAKGTLEDAKRIIKDVDWKTNEKGCLILKTVFSGRFWIKMFLELLKRGKDSSQTAQVIFEKKDDLV